MLRRRGRATSGLPELAVGWGLPTVAARAGVVTPPQLCDALRAYGISMSAATAWRRLHHAPAHVGLRELLVYCLAFSCAPQDVLPLVTAADLPHVADDDYRPPGVEFDPRLPTWPSQPGRRLAVAAPCIASISAVPRRTPKR